MFRYVTKKQNALDTEKNLCKIYFLQREGFYLFNTHYFLLYNRNHYLKALNMGMKISFHFSKKFLSLLKKEFALKSLLQLKE